MYLVSLLCVIVLFSNFRYPPNIPRKPSTELLLFDPEIERTLFIQNKAEAGNADMDDQNNDRFSEGH